MSYGSSSQQQLPASVANTSQPRTAPVSALSLPSGPSVQYKSPPTQPITPPNMISGNTQLPTPQTGLRQEGTKENMCRNLVTSNNSLETMTNGINVSQSMPAAMASSMMEKSLSAQSNASQASNVPSVFSPSAGSPISVASSAFSPITSVAAPIKNVVQNGDNVTLASAAAPSQTQPQPATRRLSRFASDDQNKSVRRGAVSHACAETKSEEVGTAKDSSIATSAKISTLSMEEIQICYDYYKAALDKHDAARPEALRLQARANQPGCRPTSEPHAGYPALPYGPDCVLVQRGSPPFARQYLLNLLQTFRHALKMKRVGVDEVVPGTILLPVNEYPSTNDAKENKTLEPTASATPMANDQFASKMDTAPAPVGQVGVESNLGSLPSNRRRALSAEELQKNVVNKAVKMTSSSTPQTGNGLPRTQPQPAVKNGTAPGIQQTPLVNKQSLAAQTHLSPAEVIALRDQWIISMIEGRTALPTNDEPRFQKVKSFVLREQGLRAVVAQGGSLPAGIKLWQPGSASSAPTPSLYASPGSAVDAQSISRPPQVAQVNQTPQIKQTRQISQTPRINHSAADVSPSAGGILTQAPSVGNFGNGMMNAAQSQRMAQVHGAKTNVCTSPATRRRLFPHTDLC